jgi:hypothetical protein
MIHHLNGINKKPEVNSIFDVTQSSEALRKQYEFFKPEFIISPIIYKNGINIIGAERGTGKTRLMLALACAIAYEQKDFLGYPIQNYGDILFINLEIPEDGFSTFIDPIERFYENQNLEKKHALNICNLKSNPHILISEIEKLISTFGPKLVFIDGYKAFASRLAIDMRQEREWDNHSMYKLYVQTFDDWRKKYGVTIILSNHTNKGTKGEKSHSDLLFGPGALIDFADHTTLIRKTDNSNERLIIPDKSRFAEEGIYGSNLFSIQADHPTQPNELFFKLLESNVSESEHMYRASPNSKYPDEVKERALKLIDEGHTYEEAAEQVLGSRGKKGTISKWNKERK